MHISTGAVGPVRLAWARSHPPADDAAPFLRALGAAQHTRWSELGAPRADVFLTGRMLLAALVRDLAPGATLRVSSVCDVCGDHHGAPRVIGAPVVVSVSSAGGWVVAAAAPVEAAAAVGVDIEASARGPVPGLSRLFPAATPDAAGWTRIEAVLKADGRGLRVPPEEVRIAEEGVGGDASTSSATRGVGSASRGPVLPGALGARVPGRAEVIEVVTLGAGHGPDGHVVSVAVISAARSAR